MAVNLRVLLKSRTVRLSLSLELLQFHLIENNFGVKDFFNYRNFWRNDFF